MKFISAFLAVFSLLALAGCNTIEGIGKDIKAGGAAIERTADQNKK
jgi:entericidin B